MRLRLWVKIIVLGLLVFPSISYGQQKKWPSSVLVCGGSSTVSTVYLEGVAVSRIINKYIPSVKASPITVQGAIGAQERLLKGEVDLAYMTSWSYRIIFPLDLAAQQKQYPLLYKGRSRIRQVIALSKGVQQVIAKTGINSFADLKGKRFAYEAPGAFGKPELWDAVFEYYKIKPKEIIGMLEPKGVGDEARLFKEGLVDATSKSSTPPVTAYTELFRDMSGKLHLLSLSKEADAYVRKKVPFHRGHVVPAGTYPGQDKDVLAMAYQEGFMTLAEMPEDFVYQIVKNFHEHLSEVTEVDPQFKAQFSLKNSVSILMMPIHPGAKKYYKEAGVWTDELEKENKELLSKLGVSE